MPTDSAAAILTEVGEQAVTAEAMAGAMVGVAAATAEVAVAMAGVAEAMAGVAAEEATPSDEFSVATGRPEFDLKDQETMTVMNNQTARIAGLLLCVLGLVVVQGCATPQDQESAKPWSQIAAEEQPGPIMSPDDGGLLP